MGVSARFFLICSDELREHLKNAPKMIMAQKRLEASDSDSSSDSSSGSSSEGLLPLYGRILALLTSVWTDCYRYAVSVDGTLMQGGIEIDS